MFPTRCGTTYVPKWRQIIRKPNGLRVFFWHRHRFSSISSQVSGQVQGAPTATLKELFCGRCVLKCWEKPRIWMLDHDDHDDHDCPFLLMAVNWGITWYYQRVSNVAMENPVQMEVHMGKASINGWFSIATLDCQRVSPFFWILVALGRNSFVKAFLNFCVALCGPKTVACLNQTHRQCLNHLTSGLAKVGTLPRIT